MRNILFHFFCLFLLVEFGFAQNVTVDSFEKAKHILETEIYTTDEMRKTLYCNAQFYEDKSVDLPEGFTTEKYKNRMDRIEWEHVVPAENFGRTFPEWHDGHPQCVDDEGKAFKGRRCAELVSEEYRLMASDLHNLYPTIGSVNANRSNYNFAVLPHAESDFGTCETKIDNRKVEPAEHARGRIARAYLYMETTYPRYRMSDQQRKLMQAWDKMYPITDEEKLRSKKIEAIQRNGNRYISHKLELAEIANL